MASPSVSNWSLVWLGFAMGVVHVLTGPDHMTALATMSVGQSWRAMALGIRWGLGHSTGLIVVALLLVALNGKINLDTIGRYCDMIVGMVMIVLGTLGMRKARQSWRTSKGSSTTQFREMEKDLEDDFSVGDYNPAPQEPAADGFEKVDVGGGGGCCSPSSRSPTPAMTEDDSVDSSNSDEFQARSPLIERDSLAHNKYIQAREFQLEEDDDVCDRDEDGDVGVRQGRCLGINRSSAMTQRLVAFGVGIVHGIAGPGGILGVLPAIHLQSLPKSSIYLGIFCLTSTLVMGIFAALYGQLTLWLSSKAPVQAYLEAISGFSSFSVGVAWIVLSATGKMSEFFD